MEKDDRYYDLLDKELTETLPEVDLVSEGLFPSACASIVVLKADDMRIASTLAQKNQMSIGDYLSSALRRELASA